MARVTYRVQFCDGGIGARSGLLIIYPLGQKRVRLAIQSSSGTSRERFLVHVASGQRVSKTSIDSIMSTNGCSETDAAAIIFNTVKNTKGEDSMLKHLEKAEILNPSPLYV